MYRQEECTSSSPSSKMKNLMSLIILSTFLQSICKAEDLESCQKTCSFSLVESIPEGIHYSDGKTPFASTFSVWSEMIREATETIDIASFYWSLKEIGDQSPAEGQSAPKYPGTEQGEVMLNSLLEAGTKRNLKVRIVRDKPARTRPSKDTDYLESEKAAEVRTLDFRKLLGAGILHTKMLIVDRKSAYVGSANLDWRSLTQVKELGIYIKNCPCFVKDTGKIFDVYWMLGSPDAKLPKTWPLDLATKFNKETPMPMIINSANIGIYATSSPSELCPDGRTSDLDGVLSVIQKARKFIYISLMDYFPLELFRKKPRYWGDIDNSLRAAAIEYVAEVRLLIGWWDHTRDSSKNFLRSLVDLTGSYPGVKIAVKIFTVPSTAEQKLIPYARVNHNKFMVTENATLIGTSNWAGDYFISTGGVSVITEGSSELRDQLEGVFLRDWNSEFSQDLSH